MAVTAVTVADGQLKVLLVEATIAALFVIVLVIEIAAWVGFHSGCIPKRP